MSEPTRRTVSANGLDFTVLELGSGPLALCLHGFPDSAHTWRYLLPQLAESGFHAVAPFMRGYAPSGLPADGCYGTGALVADAAGLHDALDGTSAAVLIGHDWGAETAYGAAAFAPDRWRRLVTMSIPPAALYPEVFSDYTQLKRSFYMFYFQAVDPADAVPWGQHVAFLELLWNDWSPGYDAREDLGFVAEALNDPVRLVAALEYYRAEEATQNSAYTKERDAVFSRPPQPTLYLHGAQDGCIGSDYAKHALPHLAPGSQVEVIDAVGHFLHLERPAAVNELILAHVTS